jgi:hypothetical protein
MDLSRVELLWINNALNEVLHGPAAIDDDGEFHSRTGGDRQEVQALLRKVSDRLDDPDC